MTRIKNNYQSRTRNILLIGRTGSGKSSLANLLSQSDEFKRSSESTSETRGIQSKIFSHQDISFKVIDTIGLDDTKLENEKVLNLLAKAAEELNGEINQIFFVVKEKMTEKELESYNLLGEVLFDKHVHEYTTIIRTNFPRFRNKEACQKDIEKLKKEKVEIKELIKNCNEIIHINNIGNEVCEDWSSDEEEERQQTIKDYHQKLRNQSREMLLEHLIKNCFGNYRPDLAAMTIRVNNYLSETKRLKKELAEMRERLEVNQEALDEKEKELEETNKNFFRSQEENRKNQSKIEKHEQRWEQVIQDNPHFQQRYQLEKPICTIL